MDNNFKICPNSPNHIVVGGFPEFVCTECATEWVLTNRLGKLSILYTQFNKEGNVVKRWRVPIVSVNDKKMKRRRLTA
ncbi:hypothetical protein SAMN02745215_04662 [Desulfitobacterium chlororespirans DSM 11544]|uniref:Uncharacterized protein n=1 Tax=Desulfitobacterium chlororespirans DSM 11544 TaxID=1121395 RepID=A0A1M7UUD2_9FIRM|nr:hypothetical protein SAMN02745215_04662 [Desulfitobacterium chlororespirans DSM 11544]